MKRNNTYNLSNLTLVLGFLVLVTACQKPTNYDNTEDLLRAMKIKNDGEWFKHFTFKQSTIFFDETGKQTDSAVWYEAVSYPYLFRIDRDLEQGAYTIYRNDSTYHFRQDSLMRATDQPAVHLLFKGGLYFVSLEESLKKLKKYKYNTAAFRKDTFMEEPVYVIGDDDSQFWLHATDFYCMRRISTTSNGKLLDIVYDDFKPLGRGWVEQKVTFYFDGKKRMEEFYFDIKLREHFDSKSYDVKENYQWFRDYYPEVKNGQ